MRWRRACACRPADPSEVRRHPPAPAAGANRPVLIIFGGLSGSGKTTLARALASGLGAALLRIDSIEQAILRSSLRPGRVEEAGYLVAHAVAEDNLRLGLTVVADSVNPLRITRAGWRGVAERAAPLAERSRSSAPTATRTVAGSRGAPPTSRASSRRAGSPSAKRAYEPWPEAVRIDTAGRSVDACLAELAASLGLG